MASNTRGYNSYRGRGNAVKIIICVLLVMVLLGAVAYLVVQNYMVYDADGSAHLELPQFYKKIDTKKTEESMDVEIDVLEPEIKRPTLTAIHASELVNGCLSWNSDYVLTLAPEVMVLDVKDKVGNLTYASDVKGASYAGDGKTRANLETLLGSGKYAVGRIACFCDARLAADDAAVALCRENGNRWYDGSGYAWINPAAEKTEEYILALVNECAELGFDEILLDYFSYPTSGDWNNLPTIAAADKVQVLTDFVQALRKTLPENVALSAVVRSEISKDFGLTEELLLTEFDRVYVAYGIDPAPLQTAAEALDAKYVAEVVPMVYRVPETGSYLKLWYVAPATEE